jgi:hypothetical protein
VDEEEEIEIDRLRLAAFKTNSNEDKAAYYLTVSKWFQDRHSRALTSQNAVEGEAVAWQIGNDGALYPTKEAADKHIAGWALKGQVCGPARPLYARPAPPVSPTRTMADVLGDQKIGVTLQNRPVIG